MRHTRLAQVLGLVGAFALTSAFQAAPKVAPKAGEPGPAAAAKPVAGGVLTAAEVNRQIVGHSVALTDGGMTWYFNPGGKYDADDGRSARGGTYLVRPDGRLCWSDDTGVSGCFQYYRKGGALMVRRADAGHDFELGAVKTGPLL